ncbi:MAG TPA: uracil-DNA glycosylase [Syntrophomonadaceae bacterium]|nr:uracil-DNA glycosylase [Syntrophomonadaceae bacterium]
MTIEQPGLFGDAPGQKRREMAESIPIPAKPISLGAAFLPGVKAEDAYADISDYQSLKELSRECSRCRLRSTCQQVVFGSGDVHSRIMFIGEGPGKDEDIQGEPFVGKAGQLLDKILDAGGFHRPSVYICNVVKCRPPGNRLPNPDEVKECNKYLEAQIRIIQPKIIVCLGALASQVVIDPKARITQIRGRWFSRQGVQIMGTFHPAALLRNESYKRPTWEDIKLISKAFQTLSSG